MSRDMTHRTAAPGARAAWRGPALASLFTLSSALGAACSTARAAAQSPAAANSTGALEGPALAALELIESAPVEAALDHADLRKAKDLWPQMFERAKKSIDLSEFYVSELPGSALSPSLAALEAAAARGVKVRLLADSKMARTYPETLARLAKEANVQVEQIDFHALAGGVQHAKYFVIDAGETEAEAYEGSQNFDWRSLSQIQETGLRFRAPEAVRALEDVFETDWALAGGAAQSFRAAPRSAYRFPAPTDASGKDEGSLTFVASPKGWLPDESTWDLPKLVQLIDGAQRTVQVQVLTYRAHGREEFPELEDALKRAASRGVQVKLLVSHWSLRKGTVEPLQTLAAWRPDAATKGGLPIDVRVLTIPQLKSGYLPFARVAHAKYLVVDGTRAWVGTSNWERSYFTTTRNVGLIIEGGPIPMRLEQFFEENLASGYVAPIDPNRSYEQPRTGE